MRKAIEKRTRTDTSKDVICTIDPVSTRLHAVLDKKLGLPSSPLLNSTRFPVTRDKSRYSSLSRVAELRRASHGTRYATERSVLSHPVHIVSAGTEPSCGVHTDVSRPPDHNVAHLARPRFGTLSYATPAEAGV